MHLRFYLDEEVSKRGGEFEAPRTGDAGFDLRSAESLIIPLGTQILVPTGLYLSLPLGWVGIIKDRSSMAMKRIYSHAGVIDASYRGEVKVLLSNHGTESYHIEEGAKVAQMVVVPHLIEAEQVASREALGETERGSEGFGSTGSR